MPKAKKSKTSVASKYNGGKTLAIFIRFDGEEGKKQRAALDRVAKYYKLSRAAVIRALVLEADRYRAQGKKLEGVVG